jgi:uncharacterized protein (TIGR00730 family)
MVARGYGLVFGGGRIGLMGEVALAVAQAGGDVLGVIPEGLETKEISFRDAGELIVVGSMHERKALMADRADVFVALPGGYGTCDELFEILTWAQLGIHHKPIILWNICGFFNPLINWVHHMTAEGMLSLKNQSLLRVALTLEEVFTLLAHPSNSEPATAWLEPDER